MGIDLRTKEGRLQRPRLARRACELRYEGWRYDQIGQELGIAPSTVAAMLWDELGLAAKTLDRELGQRAAQQAVETRQRKRRERAWTIEADHDETGEITNVKCIYDGTGKRITDPFMMEIELTLWELEMDGEIKYVEVDGQAAWQSTKASSQG